MRCSRCCKPLPDYGVHYYRGLPFGSHCYKVLYQRALQRGQGTQVKGRIDPRLDVIFWSSYESDQACPDSQVHCISCPEFHKKSCALEKSLQPMNRENSR